MRPRIKDTPTRVCKKCLIKQNIDRFELKYGNRSRKTGEALLPSRRGVCRGCMNKLYDIPYQKANWEKTKNYIYSWIRLQKENRTDTGIKYLLHYQLPFSKITSDIINVKRKVLIIEDEKRAKFNKKQLSCYRR